MDWLATHAYLDYDEIEVCDNCKCQFRVRAYKQAGHNETEEYQCPDCRKIFYRRACISPEVQKISDRTDGKTDLFNNKD